MSVFYGLVHYRVGGLMNKKEKKSIISESIDLANGRFKDYEVDRLFDLASNSDEYIGKRITKKHSFTNWSSDGKYTRDEETTYTINSEDGKITIDEEYSYHDDDGQSGGYSSSHSTARQILSILSDIFDN